MPFKFDTLILFVKDINRLKDFYVNVFQLKIIEDIPHEWVLLNAGGAQIGLHQAGAAYLDSDPEQNQINSNTKIVFEIEEDIQLVRHQLMNQGVTVKEVQTWEAYQYRVCDGTDPEGNVFQLKQKK